MVNPIERERWWPLCLGEQVAADRPAAFRWGEIELALFRDAAGQVRAVEDSCPHRRAPLSLGRTTSDGHIQCGYHGWIFNGETGAVSGFPNLEAGERLPRCAVTTYPVREVDGWVYLWPGAGEAGQAPSLQQSPERRGEVQFHGQAMQALTHRECVAALLDSPGLLARYLGIEFLDKALGDSRVQEGALVADRAARWNLLGESVLYLGPLRHRADFPLRLRTATAAVTGQTSAWLYAGEDRLLAQLQIVLVPGARDMTAISWRAGIFPHVHGVLAPLLRLLCKLRISPFRMNSRVNSSALAAVLPGPGRDWQEMADVVAAVSVAADEGGAEQRESRYAEGSAG